jgi:hypothetical protein
MKEDDLVVQSRDRSTWTEEQKRYHDKMPWLPRAKRLAQHTDYSIRNLQSARTWCRPILDNRGPRLRVAN